MVLFVKKTLISCHGAYSFLMFKIAEIPVILSALIHVSDVQSRVLGEGSIMVY